ncbi:MAG: hypothetical protein ACKN85_16805, partial [Pirellula sp.]
SLTPENPGTVPSSDSEMLALNYRELGDCPRYPQKNASLTPENSGTVPGSDSEMLALNYREPRDCPR